jgi:chromate transporter
MARRENLCRPGGVVAIPAGTGEQQGRHRARPVAGYAGALAAWTGFTLPSAIALVLFGYGVTSLGNALGSGWLHGLKVAAVAVVAQAVLTMMRSLAPDRARATLAVAAAALVLGVPSSWGQIGAIVLGAAIGLLLFRDAPPADHASLPHPVSRTVAIAAIILFFTILIGLPLVVAATANHSLQLFEVFYRASSLVFGGGHVVLPLLQAAVVPPGWVSNDAFLAGYGAAQAVPQPWRW